MTKVRDSNVRPSVCVPVSRTKKETKSEREREIDKETEGVRRSNEGRSEEFIGTGQVYELYIPIPAHPEHTCSLRIPGDFF